MDDDFQIPIKWAETKCYIRLDSNQQPQLIRIEPVISVDGELIPQAVMVYVDEQATLMDRSVAEAFIASTHCSPLEVSANYKHRKVH